MPVKNRNPVIARGLFWDALALAALSVYELFTRLDAMWGPLKMFAHLASDKKVPLWEILTEYVDYGVFAVPLYMLGCVILALCTLFSHRTRRTCLRLLIPAALLTAAGFSLRLTIFGEWLRTLKMLPLVILLALCLAHVLIRPLRKKRPEPLGTLPIRRRRAYRHAYRRAA